MSSIPPEFKQFYKYLQVSNAIKSQNTVASNFMSYCFLSACEEYAEDQPLSPQASQFLQNLRQKSPHDYQSDEIIQTVQDFANTLYLNTFQEFQKGQIKESLVQQFYILSVIYSTLDGEIAVEREKGSKIAYVKIKKMIAQAKTNASTNSNQTTTNNNHNTSNVGPPVWNPPPNYLPPAADSPTNASNSVPSGPPVFTPPNLPPTHYPNFTPETNNIPSGPPVFTPPNIPPTNYPNFTPETNNIPSTPPVFTPPNLPPTNYPSFTSGTNNDDPSKPQLYIPPGADPNGFGYSNPSNSIPSGPPVFTPPVFTPPGLPPTDHPNFTPKNQNISSNLPHNDQKVNDQKQNDQKANIKTDKLDSQKRIKLDPNNPGVQLLASMGYKVASPAPPLNDICNSTISRYFDYAISRLKGKDTTQCLSFLQNAFKTWKTGKPV